MVGLVLLVEKRTGRSMLEMSRVAGRRGEHTSGKSSDPAPSENSLKESENLSQQLVRPFVFPV
jgi:hypothetical protein